MGGGCIKMDNAFWGNKDVRDTLLRLRLGLITVLHVLKKDATADSSYRRRQLQRQIFIPTQVLMEKMSLNGTD